VPQFILEDAVAQGRGGACNIVCTQPRRISAVGLAHRVAQVLQSDAAPEPIIAPQA
jgi:HrpA-like RNA helicase